jgi:nitrite reductase/ring-hydroxylating ferredoxin subunit
VIDAISIEALDSGVPRRLKVGGREVVLTRWGGRVFAMKGVCPHQARALEDGTVRSRLSAGACFGDMELDLEAAPVISCPWHNWHFDLATGKCPADPKMRVKTYVTAIRNGRVWVDINA